MNCKIIILILITLSSCRHTESKNKTFGEHEVKSYYTVEKFQYDTLTIPLFFKTIIRNHVKDFYLIDSSKYNQFCTQYGISIGDSSNILPYFTINILHRMFTSQSASNCSRGEILNIPYQWHWIEPNPRHEIYFTKTKVLLKDTKPPNEFLKYNSYADIDRTPYLFLSDLVHADLKYYSRSCGTFSTFGWCSEREMAFIALSTLLSYKGKVVAEGNHSWSELLIPLKLTTGKIQNFSVIVDNTFNSVRWKKIKNDKISQWENYYGNSNLSDWYNQKAKSNSELKEIANHVVPIKSMSRIENKVVKFLDLKINASYKGNTQ